MKQRRLISMIIVALFIVQIFSINIPVKNVKAGGKDITNEYQIIKGVKITDKNGNELPQEGIDKSDKIRVDYTWSVSDEYDLKEGDYYTLKLPKEVKIISDINKEINYNGNKVADLFIGKSGKVKITFTKFIEENSNVNGGIYVECYFEEKEIGDEGSKEIIFNLQGEGKPVKIEVQFKEDESLKVKLEKSGEYNASDDTITWKVKVNSNKENIKSGTKVIDKIQEGQEYVDESAKISPNVDGEFSYSDGALTYKFNQDTKETYDITFKTKIDLNESGHGSNVVHKNKAIITDGESELESNEAVVDIPLNYISKSGTYVEKDKSINWEITVNSLKKELKNAVVTDVLPEGLELDKSSIKINGENIGDGNLIYNEGDKKFSIKLGDINDKKVITFSTKITDEKAFNSNKPIEYKNKATLTWGSGGSGGSGEGITVESGVTVPSYIIEKSGVKYDDSTQEIIFGQEYNPSTQEITWGIRINRNKVPIKSAVVKDYIEKGQEYVTGSFKVFKIVDEKLVDFNDGSFNYVSEEVSVPEMDKEAVGYFTYNFPEEIKDTYMIIYKTKVTDKNVYGNNITKKYYNLAELKGEGIEDSKAMAESNIISQVIKKTAVEYDYKTKRIKWNVVINENKMPINNAVFKDNIPKGQKYVDGSFEVDGNKSDVEYSDVSDEKISGVLIYKFKDKITEKHIITFETEITNLSQFNENGKYTFKNTAYLSGDEIAEPDVKSEGSLIVNNVLVQKDAVYKPGDNYIDWSVKINNGSIPIEDAVIEDMLQEGLELQVETVKLYKASIDNKGNYIKGEEVSLNSDNVYYDINTRKFVFKFTEKINDSYILDFKTSVTKEGSYLNKVSFTGKGIEESSQVTVKDVVSSNGGGWAVGETAAIKIIKVDKDNTNKKLKGAVFQLLDQYENVLETSEPTGDEGFITFSKIRYNVTYFVKELTPPSGYNKSNELYEFKFSKGDPKLLEYQFKNTKISGGGTVEDNGSIRLKKEDEKGNSLKGVEFSLYNENQEKIKATLTDENGIAEFKNLKYGDYTIKETKALEGYNLLEDIIYVQVSTNNKEYDVGIIKNTKITGNIEINKVDEKGSPLKGAEFTLYNKDGKKIKSLATDSNGIVVFEDVEYGDYIIKETKAPEGYILNENTISVYIRNSQLQTFTVKNKPQPPTKPEPPTEPGGGGTIGKPETDTGTSGKGEVTTGNGKEQAGTRIPQTGGVMDTKVLTALGLTAVAVGVILLIKNRRKGEEN